MRALWRDYCRAYMDIVDWLHLRPMLRLIFRPGRVRRDLMRQLLP